MFPRLKKIFNFLDWRNHLSHLPITKFCNVHKLKNMLHIHNTDQDFLIIKFFSAYSTSLISSIKMSLTLLWFAIFQSMVIGLTDGMLTNRHLHGGIEQKLHNGKLPLDLNVQHSPKFKAVKEEDGKIGSRISPANYPQAERGNVFDEYLVGPEKTAKRVADPYRALEDPEAEGTKKFVKQLNAISGPFLKAIPSQGQMRQKMTELMNYEKFTCPVPHGDFYFYYHNTGLQNHDVLYKQETLDGEGTVFLDPNTFSEDGTTSLSQESWTRDGQILAYGTSDNGSDLVTVKFIKADGEMLPDLIPGIKFSELAWLGDNSGLFYSKYPDQKQSDKIDTEKNEFHSLYFHRMGTYSSEDILVAQRRDDPVLKITADVSEDGRSLFVKEARGTTQKNELYFYDLYAVNNKITGELKLKALFNQLDAIYKMMDSDDKTALILTNHNAPMFKLVRIRLDGPELANPNDTWEEVIQEDPDRKLEWVSAIAGDKMLVCYIEDVKNTMYIHDLQTGKELYQLPLEIGTYMNHFARKNSPELLLQFESFLTPGTVYHGDFSRNPTKPVEIKVIRQEVVKGLDSRNFELNQEFYHSKDGTRIPMFIFHRKDIKRDGNNGAILFGYGGFNVAEMPYFSASRLMVAEHLHAVIAIANIRGGSEYGEKWHEAGMREHKQNVFDDFIAAAEYLIRADYTNSKKLATIGGSNGGLLTAACSQQRPDLFGAVVTDVGVLDMLRFNKFTTGAAWVSEFGNPDDPMDFEFIYKYSPLHQLAIKPGQQWPSTMLLTADHDDRVVPMHTLKYTAQLYHLLAKEANDFQEYPVLARIEENAGHGSGLPLSKKIERLVDIYSFIQNALMLTWTDGAASAGL